MFQDGSPDFMLGMKSIKIKNYKVKYKKSKIYSKYLDFEIKLKLGFYTDLIISIKFKSYNVKKDIKNSLIA